MTNDIYVKKWVTFQEKIWEGLNSQFKDYFVPFNQIIFLICYYYFFVNYFYVVMIEGEKIMKKIVN